MSNTKENEIAQTDSQLESSEPEYIAHYQVQPPPGPPHPHPQPVPPIPHPIPLQQPLPQNFGGYPQPFINSYPFMPLYPQYSNSMYHDPTGFPPAQPPQLMNPSPYGAPYGFPQPPFQYQPNDYQQLQQQQQRQGMNNYHQNNYNHRNHSHHNHHSHNHTNGNSKKKLSIKSSTYVPEKKHSEYINKQDEENQLKVQKQEEQEKQQQHEEEEPQDEQEQQKSLHDEDQQVDHSQSQPSEQIQKEVSPTPITEDPNSLRFISDPTSTESSSESTFTVPSITYTFLTPEHPAKKADLTNNTDSHLIFQVQENNDTKLPLIFGTTLVKFLSQKKKFIKTEEDDEDEQIEKKQSELKEEPKEKVKETTPQPSPITPTTTPKPMGGWASIAQQAAQKTVKPSNTSSLPSSSTSTPSSNNHKSNEVKLVPIISNILEPLGVVLLRSMFDSTFQNYANNIKLPKIIPRGIVNTGNICFMSSILQLLLYCQPFYKSLQIISNKTLFSLNGDSKAPLFDSIMNFYKYFNIKLNESFGEESTRKFGDPITPTELYKSISSNGRFQHLKWGQQEDAEEFFGYLLDGLHEEFISSVERLTDLEMKTFLNTIASDETRNLIKQSIKKFQEDDFNSTNQDSTNNNTSASQTKDLISDDGWTEVSNNKIAKTSAKRTVEVKPSPIRQLFGGQFRSILNVPRQKESQSITLDPFQQIQLDISDDKVNTIEDAFEKISEAEEIPMKSSAGEDVIAKKQTFIDKLPEVLIIHLKRFSFNFNKNTPNNTNSYNNRGRIEKLTKKVEYKHLLTIPSTIISPTNRKFVKNLDYKLTGVVYHIGSSSDGGHYIVDVLSDHGWISIDDTTISELKEDEVLERDGDGVKSAYILMYQRV